MHTCFQFYNFNKWSKNKNVENNCLVKNIVWDSLSTLDISKYRSTDSGLPIDWLKKKKKITETMTQWNHDPISLSEKLRCFL